jgi:glycerophosphoryl diester phosphodiesterase
MINFSLKRFLVFCTIGGTLVMQSFAQIIPQDIPVIVYRGAMSLYEVYKPGSDLSTTIKATKPTSGQSQIVIKVYSDILIAGRNYNNILLYEITAKYDNTSGDYKLSPTIYTDPESALGGIGKDYPQPWYSDNVKASSWAVKRYYIANDWQIENPNKVYHDLLGSTIPVKIELYLPEGITLTEAKLPGIGQFYINGEVSSGLRFDPEHPCNTGLVTFCSEWGELKNPPKNAVDLKYAAHRGFWGNNLGAGPVENTDPSIQAALEYTNTIESDITITRDKVVVVSHDYNLQRLTDYNGPNPDNTFIYDLAYNDIKDLHLRKRNFDVTTFQFIQLKDLIGYMKKYNTVLTIDVKERARRRNPITGQCTAACDVNRQKRDSTWVELFSKILDVVEENDAWEYVAVKTPLTINRIKEFLSTDKFRKMNKILFFPVIQPGGTPEAAVAFINDWYNNAPNYIIGFETNFRLPTDKTMQPFSIAGRNYTNILHYVVSQTDLRPGMYPEEPMGPKGIVDRYAQWLFKDLSKDYRGDPFWLMSIPYFSTSILTTDRPDIWQEIEKIYK